MVWLIGGYTLVGCAIAAFVLHRHSQAMGKWDWFWLIGATAITVFWPALVVLAVAMSVGDIQEEYEDADSYEGDR